MPRVSAASTFGPVAAEERLVVLDVLRGFALLGIAIMNMSWFSLPNGYEAFTPRLFPEAYNRAAEFFMVMVVAGKANSIFSFLFGFGLTIQMQRAEAKGEGITRMYLRRLFVLFIIGVLHSVFLWHGDVLHDYALIGVVLLAVRNVPKGWIFALIASSFLIPIVRGFVALAIHEPATIPVADLVARAHLDMRIFQQGTYWEQVGARLHQLRIMHIVNALNAQGEPIFALQLMSTIMLGLYAGREKLFSNIQSKLPSIRKLTGWTFALGAASAMGAGVSFLLAKPEDKVTVTGVMVHIFMNLNRPLLCIAYMGIIVLLLQKPGASKVLQIFAPAGSMPMTNYIMQSVMATMLFYSYGFGLFGRVGPLAGIGISVAIFAVQAVASKWWVARYQHGPLEWLWRYASYGKRPPMRRTEHVAAA
jgi:uncharacterized protein